MSKLSLYFGQTLSPMRQIKAHVARKQSRWIADHWRRHLLPAHGCKTDLLLLFWPTDHKRPIRWRVKPVQFGPVISSS